MNHSDDKCSCCRLNELMEMEPENEKVYFNLGMLAMDAREFEKAREWFHQAVEVSVVNGVIHFFYCHPHIIMTIM